MRAECEQKARDLGVADSCRFLGYISSAEKQMLINACDMMCVPPAMSPLGGGAGGMGCLQAGGGH